MGPASASLTGTDSQCSVGALESAALGRFVLEFARGRDRRFEIRYNLAAVAVYTCCWARLVYAPAPCSRSKVSIRLSPDGYAAFTFAPAAISVSSIAG